MRERKKTNNKIIPEDDEGEGDVSHTDERRQAELAKQKMDAMGKRNARKLFKRQLVNYLEDKRFVLGMICATLFALYGTDLWEAGGPPPKEYDDFIYSLSTIVFVLFTVEFCLLTWCKPGYPFSFFFWLDMLAAVTLLPDVLLIGDIDVYLLIGGGDGGLSMARAGRATRALTRAVRIVRVIKLITLLRKARTKKRGGDNEEEDSKIGGRLADGITQKVIIIVGLMLFVTSLLDLLSASTDADFSTSLRSLEKLYLRCGGTNDIADIDAVNKTTGCSRVRTDCRPDQASNDTVCHFNMYLRELVVHHNGDFGGLCANTVTDDEKKQCMFTKFDELYNFSTYNFTGNCKAQTLRYLRVFTSDIFCSDQATKSLRTSPTEKVDVCHYATDKGCSDYTTSSRIVFDNIPYAKGQALMNIIQITFIIVLLAISSFLFQKDADRLVIGPLSKMATLVESLSSNPLAKIEESEGGEYETDFVERALKKFGKLLQIAFGEAGSEIIGKNLGADGDLNPMIAGKKMSAIFGFAIVRNFTDCTECLQEDVMVFVNTIADIVHRAVRENEGAPNKNIGEAFLMAWRLPDGADISQPIGTIADSALKSFVRACLAVQASEDLRKMTEHPKIQERLPGYHVTMGFGLHVGWAIEGAIGSMLKIDASYLSPNVNMAARLESGTHQFHVDILMSETFHNMLSPHVKALCRRIDRVTVKGSVQPMSLYTYDVPPCEANTLVELNPAPNVDFWEQFKPRTTMGYRKRYAEAVQLYLDGKWKESEILLRKCLTEWPGDGPASVVLEVMQAKNFVAPDNWKGYRELTAK